jgi:hypothetical protein
MASKSGLRAALSLTKKGWKYAECRSMLGDLICGNPRMIDPVTGDEHCVEEAQRIQRRREEEDGDDGAEN